MRVVIAGSSGLIGTALVPLLRRAGHEVVRLVRRSASAPDERGWDPPAGVLDAGALDAADAVVNLCGVNLGEQRWSGEFKQLLRDSRIVPTEVLAAAAAERQVPVLVNAAGSSIYGHTGDRVVDETAPPGIGFLAELCRGWEAATGAAHRGGVRVVTVRTGPVLSPAGGLVGELRPFFALGLGGRLGDGRQYLPWISLHDAAAAIRHVLEHADLSGPVNLTGPAPVTNATFTRAFGRALHRPAVLVVPGFALRIARGGELADEMALSGQRAVPAALQQHGYEFTHPSVDAALAAALDR